MMVETTTQGSGTLSSTSDSSDNTLTSVFIAVGCVGVISNIFNLVITLSSRKLRQGFTNRFIINQAALDLISAVILIASVPADRRNFTSLQGVGGELLCRLWLTKTFMWGAFISSIYNLIVLTFERYCKVVHPIFHHNNFNRRQAIIVTVVVWLIGPVYELSLEIPTAGVIDGVCVPFQYPNKATGQFCGLMTVFLEYFIPLLLIIYCYGRMAYALRSRRKTKTGGGGQGASSQAAERQKPDQSSKQQDTARNFRKSTYKTLAIVAGAFVFCWSWNSWLFLFFNLGYNVDISGPFYQFTVIAVFLNCCLNPFIYALNYR